jgi:thioredoxin-related protein
MTDKRPHPHIDDKGTLDWHAELAPALAQAGAEQKLVFIEVGREACSQCRALVQGVVPHPEIAPLLQRGFVAVASDCDDPEDAVIDLAQELGDADMLPFVLFCDARGRFLGGSSGAVNPVSFRRAVQDLLEA